MVWWGLATSHDSCLKTQTGTGLLMYVYAHTHHRTTYYNTSYYITPYRTLHHTVPHTASHHTPHRTTHHNTPYTTPYHTLQHTTHHTVPHTPTHTHTLDQRFFIHSTPRSSYNTTGHKNILDDPNRNLTPLRSQLSWHFLVIQHELGKFIQEQIFCHCP